MLATRKPRMAAVLRSCPSARCRASARCAVCDSAWGSQQSPVCMAEHREKVWLFAAQIQHRSLPGALVSAGDRVSQTAPAHADGSLMIRDRLPSFAPQVTEHILKSFGVEMCSGLIEHRALLSALFSKVPLFGDTSSLEGLTLLFDLTSLTCNRRIDGHVLWSIRSLSKRCTAGPT